MEFSEYLSKSAKEIDREVEKILNDYLKEAGKVDQKLIPLLTAFKESCQGGKRIRGVLVKLGYEVGSSKFKVQSSKLKEVLRVSAAYEIFHAAILAHDDIMDQSPRRRNQPSLYKKVGVSEAITLGDLGFFLAMKIISNALFVKIALDTAIGQLLDLKKANSLITARFKTAGYTIAGPLQLGASLAGANSKLLKLLGQFGEDLGIAFQIRDDILDKQETNLNKAEKYKNQAIKALPSITKDYKLNRLFTQMVEYMVERKK